MLKLAGAYSWKYIDRDAEVQLSIEVFDLLYTREIIHPNNSWALR